MKLFKTVDEKFAEIGFVKVAEDKKYYAHYQRQDKEQSFVQTLYLCHKSSGRHIVQSYDENLADTKGIGHACVGLTTYERQLCIKNMKQMGWKILKGGKSR